MSEGSESGSAKEEIKEGKRGKAKGRGKEQRY